MRFLSMVSNPFGCSASGERLVSAARDGDLQEAKALLECNPRLARYSTFGVRNSPLHYSAAQGHHEIVFLLLESGVDINLRNINGQTALMLACQHGHWEIVQILVLFKANVQRTDYSNGATALHFAALNGHSRCIRLLLADYVPSMPNFWSIIRNKPNEEANGGEFDESALSTIVNKEADGGITALHMAALNGHSETVHLLLDLGASVSVSTKEDGTSIDLIGAGSTPLHYAAFGGNEQCCQLLIARGASLTAENANGWTPLVVAHSWNRDRLQDILSKEPQFHMSVHPSPYLSLPLGSIMEIAREHGYRNLTIELPSCNEPCAVCLERKCTIASEGCGHEFCIRCALYLCSTYTIASTWSGPPGSIPCPLCRHPIIAFVKLLSMSPIKEPPRMSLSLYLCVTGSAVSADTSNTSTASQSCRPDFQCSRIPPLGSSSFRSLSCQRFPSVKLSPALCMGDPEASPTLVGCSRVGLRRTVSHGERCRGAWLFNFNQCAIATSR